MDSMIVWSECIDSELSNNSIFWDDGSVLISSRLGESGGFVGILIYLIPLCSASFQSIIYVFVYIYIVDINNLGVFNEYFKAE